MQKKSLKILLVEDNEAEVQQVLSAIKSHNTDHQVYVLNDGIGVVKYLQENISPQKNLYPDLVLLDLNLPKHSGRSVISEIKNHPDLKSTPIVVLTSSEYEDDIKNSYKGKISSYIVKPSGYEEMKQAICSAMDFYSITQMPTNYNSNER